MVIMALMIGAIYTLEVAAARLGSRSSRSYEAETRAAQALHGLTQDMREGIAITTAQANMLEYTYPKKDAGGKYFKSPLEVGYNVRYYLGNKAGTAQSGGTYLWRGDSSTGTMRPVEMLADKVASFSVTYQYPVGQTQPDTATMVIGVSVTSHGKTTVGTFKTTVKLRNYGKLGL
jgi:hypothetical protein